MDGQTGRLGNRRTKRQADIGADIWKEMQTITGTDKEIQTDSQTQTLD
jgi:hypothetical protein